MQPPSPPATGIAGGDWMTPVGEIAREMDRILPASLSTILHGSAANGGFSPRFSDVDLLVLLPWPIVAEKRAPVIAKLDAALARWPAWRDRLDLHLVPMPSLLRPLDRRLGGLALRKGRWQVTEGYPLRPLETLNLHHGGRTLAGSPLVSLFPPPPAPAPVDEALEALREIRATAWLLPPFQLRRAGDPGSDRAVAWWGFRLARLVGLLTTGQPAPPPDQMRHLAAQPLCRAGAEWWLTLAEAWQGGRRELPPAAEFPRQYLLVLKHLLSMAGRGRPALANLTPTPDRSGFISYHLIHQRFKMKLVLDVLFHEFTPGHGLRPRRPPPPGLGGDAGGDSRPQPGRNRKPDRERRPW